MLVTYISRQIRLPLSINSNDDQACYNRKVLWIASLALQRIKLSQKAAFSMTNTLQSATQNINTAFGLSIEKYFPTKPPLQCNGQGNDVELTIWVMISAILLTIMRDQGFGLDLVSYHSQLALVIAGLSFVDDTDIINTAAPVNKRGEDLLVQRQQVVDTWEGILNTTGGALECSRENEVSYGKRSLLQQY